MNIQDVKWRLLLSMLMLMIMGVSKSWAATYTYVVVDGDGKEIIRSTTTNGTNQAPKAPAEINSPWCNLTYHTLATGGDVYTILPGNDSYVYVRYTIKPEYEKYFSTSGDEHWYNAHCNGNYIKATAKDTGAYPDAIVSAFSAYDDESFMWTLVGDPYRANLCVKTHGIDEPLVRVSDSGTTLNFSRTVTDKHFIILDAGSGGVSFRYATEASGNKGDFINKAKPFCIWNTDLSGGRTNSGNMWTFVELQTPVTVTYHLVNASTRNVGLTMTTAQTVGSQPSLPNQSKLAPLNCTINNSTYYINANCTTTNSSAIGEQNNEFWVTYTFDAAKLKANTNIEFSTDYDHAKWMTLQFGKDNKSYLKYGNGKIIKVKTASPTDDGYDFAFIGDPFSFRIVNKETGNGMDAQDGGGTGGTGNHDLNLTTGSDNRQWALTAPSTGGTKGTNMFQIMLSSTYADATSLYWNNASPVLLYLKNNDDSNNLVAAEVDDAPRITYKIVDLSNNTVMQEVVKSSDGTVALPRHLQSPMAENYTYHATLDHATDPATRNTSDISTVSENTDVYVTYTVKSNFADGKAWIMYTSGSNGRYIHPVYQTGSAQPSSKWWMMKEMHRNYSSDDVHTITPQDYPFLDNTYAWLFKGENPDPYNALPFNKGAQMYITHYDSTRKTDYLTSNAADASLDRYAILYFDDDTDNINVTLFNRFNSKYVVYNGEGRLEASKDAANRGTAQQIVITQLPEIAINVLYDDEVSDYGISAKLTGYYKSGCTWNWDAATAPFFLDRAFVSNHKFHYAMPSAFTGDDTHLISGTVDNEKVLDDNTIWVTYTLADNWGTLTKTGENVDADGFTTDIKPSHNRNELYWYSIRGIDGNNKDIFKASTTVVPSQVTKGGLATYADQTAIDSQEGKLSQWVFLGSPYNLKIAERYHGLSSWLGISKDATFGTPAYVYNVQPDDVVTTWELLKNLTGTTPYLYLRPQRALCGEAPLVYLSKEGSAISATNYLKPIDVKYVTTTSAHTVTFKLYDKDGNYMALPENGGIEDFPMIGVADGDDMETAFSHTTMVRRYCEYKFYSDASFSTPITEATTSLSTVYVKWDYTDDAPVFSHGSNPRSYQYYMIGVGSAPNFRLMDVEVDQDNHHTFVPREGVVTPRDYKHQFAIVGNPYAFKLYNRSAGINIRRTADLNLTFDATEVIEGEEKPTTEMEFDMPVDNATVYSSTECHFRSKFSGRYLAANTTNFYMNGTPNHKTRFRYLIVPLRVFWEEKTTWTDDETNDQKDYRMYALELNPSNSARTADERFDSNDLRATNNKIGLAFDFNHAFCNYTFFNTYDWHNTFFRPIPSEGLSYYGGKEQTKRQFFATYSVDWEQFSRLQLIGRPDANNPGNADKVIEFAGKGGKTTEGDNDYYFLQEIEEGGGNSAVVKARADSKGTYRFVFTGDPYDMQITCIGTGDNYKSMPLGAKSVFEEVNGWSEYTKDGGKLMILSNDPDYTVVSHFEIIQRSNGNHVFYVVDDPKGRFNSSLHPANNEIKTLIAFAINPGGNLSVNDQMGRIKELLVVPAIPQYAVTWNIVDATTHQVVATETEANVEQGVTMTFDDMPQALRRHYCDYGNMYSDQNCTAQYTDNSVTVGDEAVNIYVPYTLDNGAPEFWTNTETVPTTESADDDYWHEISFPFAGGTVYYDGGSIHYDQSRGISEIRTSSDWDNFKWALIGTPYGVKLYNRVAQSYLAIAGDNLEMNSTGTTFDLVDDWQENLCAIYDEVSRKYVRKNVGVDGLSISDVNNSSVTSVEFSNQKGLLGMFLKLHYSDKTQRLNDEGTKSAQNDIENITISSFQKLGKSLEEVLPEYWKRAFCNYHFYWDSNTTAESYTGAPEVNTITQEMIEKSRQDSNNDICIHITYDYSGSPFNWSQESVGDEKGYENKHWYYLVNNHIQGTEEGKLVFRSTDPILRVSDGLVKDRLYLNNYEWAVIGDPYGFKLLNHYDPDQRYDEYINVSTTERDGNNEGYRLKQSVSDTHNNIFEMMPGLHSNNFWIHPVYVYDSSRQVMEWEDIETGNYSYVGNNYNGSNAIVSDIKRTHKYLHTNGAANFRLEVQSDKTLAEYVKYAGFIGGLKYDLVTDDMRADAADDDLTDEDKRAIRALVDDPDNIEQMTQGYYRIVPDAWEEKGERHYVRGYLDAREQNASSGFNRNLKVETMAEAEYDPASIFWFEETTDGTYPRYFVRTQGLDLYQNRLVESGDDHDNYKVRYENIGAAITQLKVDDRSGERAANYLSSTASTETSVNQCFDEQAGVYKTRFFLQKVGTGNDSMMPFRMKVNKGHDGTPIIDGNEAYGNLPYTYTSIYVPYDLHVIGGQDQAGNDLSEEKCDLVPFVGIQESYHPAYSTTSDTYYEEGEWALRCFSISGYQTNVDWEGSNLYIPAGTPVIFRSKSGMKDVTFEIPTTSPSSPVSANLISGTYVKKSDDNADIKVFGKESKRINEVKYYTGRVGFFPRTIASSLLANNKVYYLEKTDNTSSAQSVMFSFEESPYDDGTTSIENINTPRQYDSEGIYDLQGRKLERIIQPGIYIVNGKKRVVR